MSNKKLIMGILAGAAIGAIAGVLLAPDKGANTRKKISDKGKDFKDSFRKYYEQVEDTLVDAADKAKSKGERLADKATKKINDLTEEAKDQLA
jgi:gas vesicle protein